MGKDPAIQGTMCYHDAEWLDVAEPARTPPKEEADDEEEGDGEKIPAVA